MFAWIAVSCVTIPLFQWNARRQEVAAHIKAQSEFKRQHPNGETKDMERAEELEEERAELEAEHAGED